MEVAGNGGGGEERGPGALEDGGGASRASPQSPNHGSSQGPRHSGDRSHEGPQDDARSCEGPRDNARSHQGPRRTGTSADEGARRTGDNAKSHETPSCSGTGADEGPQDNARSREGPRCTGTTCSAEGPWDNTRSHEGPRDDARRHEGPLHTATTCSAEGPRGNARSDETPSCTGTGADEDPGNREGPHHPGASADEGPRHPGTTSPAEGPGDNSDEGRRRTGTNEEPRHAGAACSIEGPGDSSRSSEGPRRTGTNEELCHTGAAGTDTGPRGNSRSHETSGSGIDELSKGPDVSRDATAEQRHPGARVAEGPHDPRSQELSEDGERDPSSFKKPVAPGRPGGHEKGLDPRNKPGALAGDGEAPPNVVGPGLPSDAYRTAPAIPYREPPWSGRPQALYSLEVLKGGAILATKDLSQADWTAIGRLPVCHVPLEHPSVSRFHAVLQYREQPDRERGFYVYDLGSTHGTFLNKQRIPPKTYCRVRVGHVMRFGGSTRLFILQGPEEDQEAESELTVTQIKEVRRQKEDLQKRMLGDDSDEDDEPSEEGKKTQASAGEEAGCTWGMGEDAIEEENEENPIAMEFQEDREASYIKNPKKALQGFFDREGEELEFEYEERSPGSWLCRVKLPADDSAGKQLVAEVTHSGKKKEAANLCSLEACRMLEMRGLLRQEAVSRKRKSKKWEDEDFYDSDDDTFLDRTGIVEKKRLNRMKKAGKIEEKPETFESLSAKLEDVEKEMAEVAAKLKTSHTGVTQPSTQDSLDAFMTEIKAGSSMDSVSRKKLHLQSLELKKEQQRLRSLIKIVQPAKLPELCANPATEDSKPKKLNLPMFGAMKGGSKFKLKTGTVGRLPPKRTDLPASLFTMKDIDEPEEEEEEDEDDQMNVESAGDSSMEDRSAVAETAKNVLKIDPAPEVQAASTVEEKQTASPEKRPEVPESSANARSLNGQKKPEPSTKEMPKPAAERPKKMLGPSKPPRGALSTQYPEDDPDYCVWTPPAGQSGDGKTHLNEKYGY